MQTHARWPFFGHACGPDGPSCVRPVRLHFIGIRGLGIDWKSLQHPPPQVSIKCRCAGPTQKGHQGQAGMAKEAPSCVGLHCLLKCWSKIFDMFLTPHCNLEFVTLVALSVWDLCTCIL